MIKGQLTQIVPDRIRPGDPLTIYVSFEAESTEGWHQWRTRVKAITGGLSDVDDQSHFGKIGNRDREKMVLGTMAEYDVQVDIYLYGFDAVVYGQWKLVDQRSVIIKAGTTQYITPEPIAVDLPDQQQIGIADGSTNGRTAPITIGPPGYTPEEPGLNIAGMKVGSTSIFLLILGIGISLLLTSPGKKTKKG